MSLQNIATYRNYVEIKPKKINFIYGSNGSGKTTISNLIGRFNKSDDCVIETKKNSNSSILVYNKKFVEKNFSQSDIGLKGIFTLGENSINLQDNLNELRRKIQVNEENIYIKEKTIRGFEEEIEERTNIIKDKIWNHQKEISKDFPEAFVGYKNNKQKFLNQCIKVYEENILEKSEEILTNSLEKLKENYNISFSDDIKLYEVFNVNDTEKILEIEKTNLIEKVIVGGNDSLIGQFIQSLKNSDWVKQGLDYLDYSNHTCPFCNQSISEKLEQEIKDYFNEEYEQDLKKIKEIKQVYSSCFEKIESNMLFILRKSIPYLNTKLLSKEFEVLEKQYEVNQKQLKEKLRNPSQKLKIKSLVPKIENINEIISSLNESIETNNNIIRNKEREQNKFKKNLWIYIVNNMKQDLKEYVNFKNGKFKAIANIRRQISGLKNENKKTNKEIGEIETNITSVEPTVKNINEILNKFDFKGFKLQENSNAKGTYLIVREDGSNANETMSEGEYNFITFLYFYYLVYGSHESTSLTSNKIVIIDDPISSLDSNVLFIVSTLVKNLINDCRNNKNGIQQIFNLTHNIYFHKEITFLGSRERFSPNEVMYGIIRKKDNISYFNTYENNPIESSYQLMWKELNSEEMSPITSFNTMRRILEYYFNIIGGMDYEKCINKFDGIDKILCKSLISGINDGSHFISDDFVITFDEASMRNYKRVFKLVFEKLGHIQHFEMMSKNKIK
ncbi:TPA: AAA family ATPase [Staphylococcus aureus]|nr:AAA family ATPase [Staphylococcus aureus]